MAWPWNPSWKNQQLFFQLCVQYMWAPHRDRSRQGCSGPGLGLAESELTLKLQAHIQPEPNGGCKVRPKPSHLVNQTGLNKTIYELYSISSNCLDKLSQNYKLWAVNNLIQTQPNYYMGPSYTSRPSGLGPLSTLIPIWLLCVR